MTIKPTLYHSGGKPGPFQKLLTQLSGQPTMLTAGPRCFDVPSGGQFVIVFETNHFAPGHQVTVRNDWDGWTSDLLGEFWEGKWVFRLDPDRYPQPFKFKFAINGVEMNSDPMDTTARADMACVYQESAFVFPATSDRLQHGIDNLTTTKTKQQQELLPGRREQQREYDVIIVGSGMGGGVLADALSDNDVTTLVLEAGSLAFQTHIDNLPGHTFNFGVAEKHQVGHYDNRPNSGSTFMFGVQMNLGGRSVFWEGLIPRMDDWEMDHWPESVRMHLSAGGGYEAAERLVRRRKTLGPFQDMLVAKMQKEFNEFHVADLPRSVHQPNLGPGASSVTNILENSTGVFSTADLLLDSLSTDRALQRPYLTVNLNHLVTEIKTDGSRATEVVCQDLCGNVERTYRGKIIVLAAGSLESPRIALASGLKDDSDKIGIGLTDHPAFVQKSLVELDPGGPFSGERNHAKIMMRHREGASHPYSVEVLINPRYWSIRHSDEEVRMLATSSTNKTFATVKFLFDSPLDDSNEIRFQGAGKRLEVFVKPNESGLPLRDEVRELRNRILTFLQADFDPDEEMDYHSNGTVHHAGGTLRMSDDGSGVVDQNLKFEQYENLYCCDVSVFPHIPTANPALTLVALAQRLAAYLTTKVHLPQNQRP